MATQMDDLIKNVMNILKWMTTGKAILCQKDSGKENAVNNYFTDFMPFCHVKANDWNNS